MAGVVGARVDAAPATARLVGRRCIASCPTVFGVKLESLYSYESSILYS